MPDQLQIRNKFGQLWEKSRYEPYRRKDGTETRLAVWRSWCAKCGAEFEVTTPEGVVAAEQSHRLETRRCPKHRRHANVIPPIHPAHFGEPEGSDLA